MFDNECKCCEVLKAENEHLRKWINRLMDEKSPDPNPEPAPPDGDIIPNIPEPEEDLNEMVKYGEG